MNRSMCRKTMLLALCLSTAPTPARAAPGDLDPDLGGFGTDGKIPALDFNATAMVIDDQGRLVLAGTKANTFFVQRRSGARFLTVENVATPITINDAQVSAGAQAVAIAPDGKIVVAGSVELPGFVHDFAVVRLNPDLTPDETFSGDGRQTSDFDDKGDFAYGVAVQTLCGPPPRGCDHRIVVVGAAEIEGVIISDNDFAVERFNEDGTLDTSFDGNGKGTYDISGGDDARAVAIQDDGKVLVAGQTYSGTESDFAIARLNLDGSLDDTFGGGGVVTTGFGAYEEATSLALAPDGKIVVAGNQSVSLCGDIHVLRYLPNGAPDDTFDFDGRITTVLDGGGTANGVVVQPDGKVVVAGRDCLPNPDGFVLIRYNPDGSLDGAFGTGGIAFTSFDPNGTQASALALQPDGMLVAAGGGQAARYRWDGSLDAGGIAHLIFHPDHTGSEATALAVAGDGKLVAAGKVFVGDYELALARFEANYRNGLDLSFGTDSPSTGRTLYGLDGLNDEVRALALQPDGKAVVAGQNFNPLPVPNFNFLVGRFDAAGTPDAGCDGEGLNAEDFGSSGDDTAAAVTLGPDNRIYAAGTVRGPANDDFGLVRFTTGCIVDFAGIGTFADYKFRFDLGGDEQVGGLVLQASGLPVLAGTSGGDIVLVRVRVNRFGLVSFDPAFGLNGQATLDAGGNEVVTGLAQRADGELIVSGTVDRGGSSDFFVARLTVDGQIDPTFGSGGVGLADFNDFDTAHALAVRADGTIAVAGSTNTPDGIQFAVAQFTESGLSDTGFHGNGRATLRLGAAGEDVAQAVTFVGPDRLVAGGYSVPFATRQFALAAFETTEVPEPSAWALSIGSLVVVSALARRRTRKGRVRGESIEIV